MKETNTKEAGKKTFKIVMNDRFYDDGWAEPYLLTVTTDIPDTVSVKNIVTELQRIANGLLDELPCSEEGIAVIMEKFNEMHPNTTYICEIVPGVAFGMRF